MLTSGTTAAPKAVAHTRGSLGASFAAMREAVSFAPGDRLCSDQLMIGMPVLLGGGHWRVPRPHRIAGKDPKAFAGYLEEATHTFFTPADLPKVLEVIGDQAPPRLRGLRQILLGGAPVTPALLRRSVQTLPHAECLAVYGMTEILPVAVASSSAKLNHTGLGDPLGEIVPGVRGSPRASRRTASSGFLATASAGATWAKSLCQNSRPGISPR